MLKCFKEMFWVQYNFKLHQKHFKVLIIDLITSHNLIKAVIMEISRDMCMKYVKEEMFIFVKEH